MPMYCPILPTLLSLVLLLCHAEVLHHSTPRSSRVLLVWHAEVLHHSTPRSSPLCCYYGMPRYCTILPHAPPLCCYYAMSSYCTILPHAPLPCAAIMACRDIAPFYPRSSPCAAIMPCRGIAPFYPTLLSLVLLLCHVELLHHSTPRSSPCAAIMPCRAIAPFYPTLLPCAAIMPCRGIAPFYPTLLSLAAIMPCRGIAPFYPTLLSLVLLLWHAEYCSILPHAPLPCAAIMACRCIAPFYPTLLSLVLLLCHDEVLHHSTPRSSPLCCYYAMSRYCTILPHAPLPCAAIMPCRGTAPFYPTLLSLVLLLWHAEVLHHSTSRSSPLCCHYAMSMNCTILPHAPLPCAASMPCRCIAPFYPTLLSLVLLLCHAEVLHHSTSRSSPLCCYYAMSMNCTILPHTPLPCAAIMACRGIAPF